MTDLIEKLKQADGADRGQRCGNCKRWDSEFQTPKLSAQCLWHDFNGPAPEWFDQPYMHDSEGVDCPAFQPLLEALPAKEKG